jgi:hypothetical protein
MLISLITLLVKDLSERSEKDVENREVEREARNTKREEANVNIVRNAKFSFC